MGCCGGEKSEAENLRNQKFRSDAIDRVLEEDSKRLRHECKLLLLGPGNSGKSTIVKQMKIIHQDGYTQDERLFYRHVIYKNLLDSAKALIEAIQHFEIEVEDPENNANCRYIRDYVLDPDPSTPIEMMQFGLAVKAVWRDPCIPKVLEHSHEICLMDSAPYFFDEALRIASSDFIPDEADILRAKYSTCGIDQIRFAMGQLSIHLFDISRVRGERRKWIHCLEHVTSIIFCVALSEYDHVLLGNYMENQMMESMVLFDSIVNSRWFRRTPIILFLNKVDLFRAKLAKSPLANYFPDYAGGNDVNRAAEYLISRFNQNCAHLSVYPHLTQATDTSNIRHVFAALRETIAQFALRDSGLLGDDITEAKSTEAKTEENEAVDSNKQYQGPNDDRSPSGLE